MDDHGGVPACAGNGFGVVDATQNHLAIESAQSVGVEVEYAHGGPFGQQ